MSTPPSVPACTSVTSHGEDGIIYFMQSRSDDKLKIKLINRKESVQAGLSSRTPIWGNSSRSIERSLQILLLPLPYIWRMADRILRLHNLLTCSISSCISWLVTCDTVTKAATSNDDYDKKEDNDNDNNNDKTNEENEDENIYENGFIHTTSIWWYCSQ